ncbi:redoxin family protein [Aestuariibaculum sp. M13]|uniref:redoxin family protein n=1 Tax=Aestuariibaculum sp. M13 TaxID=2967132 RepID=UPI002159E656|nr:redoxin family protein [Aestuariibaculum sp. M13]MCR8668922.1 redoxin family protein [Aestuariibaculum sp. M13]
MKKIYLVLCLSSILSVGCSSSKKASKITQEQLNQMDSVAITKTIKKLLKSENEEDFRTVVKYYNSKKDVKKINEVAKKAREKFPFGYHAVSRQSGIMDREKDPELKAKAFDELRKNFSHHKLEMAYYTMVLFQLEHGEYNQAIAYQQEMKNTSRFRYYLLNIIVQHADKSGVEIDKVKLFKTNLEAFQAIKENTNDDEKTLRTLRYGLAEAYCDKGKVNEALEVMSDISKTNKKISLKDALILSKCGDYEEVIPVFENAIIDGRLNEETKYYLERAYKAEGGVDFNLYFEELINKMNDGISKHVSEIMINDPSPNFVIKDIDGNEVTNEDFKGKILVIDFWATWCGPCKQSFPGMKAAANKYKNDKDVKFLFVHTFEKQTDPLTLAKNYLSENNYDFDLYMDYRNKETRTNQAATAFGITGIPTKVVIDDKGNLRFKVVGFNSDKNIMVAELSAMIDMIKKEDLQ